jgi:hypothetical protein
LIWLMVFLIIFIALPFQIKIGDLKKKNGFVLIIKSAGHRKTIFYCRLLRIKSILISVIVKYM